MSEAAKPATSKKTIIVLCAILVVVVAGVVGYYLYQNSLQPNIQLTKVSFGGRGEIFDPEETVFHLIVTSSGNFSYTTNQTIYIYFRLTCSAGERRGTLTYSIAGINQTWRFAVGGEYAQSANLRILLTSGQTVSGRLSITYAIGPLFQGVDFKIGRQLGRQTQNFSFTPVNTGGSNGYATVALQADGKVVWTKTYYVQIGQQTQYSETVSIPDLDPHQFSLVVLSVN